eukprot:6200357-Pleurochrysis_carterae.AAC.1
MAAIPTLRTIVAVMALAQATSLQVQMLPTSSAIPAAAVAARRMGSVYAKTDDIQQLQSFAQLTEPRRQFIAQTVRLGFAAGFASVADSVLAAEPFEVQLRASREELAASEAKLRDRDWDKLRLTISKLVRANMCIPRRQVPCISYEHADSPFCLLEGYLGESVKSRAAAMGAAGEEITYRRVKLLQNLYSVDKFAFEQQLRKFEIGSDAELLEIAKAAESLKTSVGLLDAIILGLGSLALKSGPQGRDITWYLLTRLARCNLRVAVGYLLQPPSRLPVSSMRINSGIRQPTAQQCFSPTIFVSFSAYEDRASIWRRMSACSLLSNYSSNSDSDSQNSRSKVVRGPSRSSRPTL